MRSRNIKTGFWENEILGSQSDTVRILFIGLWCLADRNGKLEERPEKIRHQLFGYSVTPPDINRELTVLSRLGFIKQYEVGGRSYIVIPNFRKHQSPHHTEKSSEIPDYQQSPLRNGYTTESSPLHSSLNPESGILNPEPPQAILKSKSVAFDDLWLAYPNKDGKKRAEKSFYGSVRNEKDLFDIKVAMKNYLSSERVSKGYVKNGSTWFSQWRDWIDWKEFKAAAIEEKKEIIL